jgi:hypothetical protein
VSDATRKLDIATEWIASRNPGSPTGASAVRPDWPTLARNDYRQGNGWAAQSIEGIGGTGPSTILPASGGVDAEHHEYPHGESVADRAVVERAVGVEHLQQT